MKNELLASKRRIAGRSVWPLVSSFACWPKVPSLLGSWRARLARSKRGRFVLVSDTQREAGTWDVGPKGEAVLSLRDNSGKIRLMAVGDAKDPGVSVNDSQGKMRANLGLHEDAPFAALYDEGTQTRALLAVGKTGPLLSLSDAQKQAANGDCRGIGRAIHHLRHRR
ncbi:MAG: hypothetical protein HY901_16300 [Deltaproteobacteria bacterium]|nr:hypothetical protein [Deltaproteobacteria bacterium]